MVKKEKPVVQEEFIKTMLGDAMQAIKTEEEPLVLNEYRRIFRKTVPFTLRSYVAAYLIKELEHTAVRSKQHNRRLGRYQERSRSAASEHPVLNPSQSVSIFMNIGRNRRVFPRDIITLLIQNTNIPREHIGDIRILENYSFVQVMASDAENIIEKLNNRSYRGRTLSISYSRKEDTAEPFFDQNEAVNEQV